MAVNVSCPYCNAGVALAEVPPSGRTVCPRCGEAFPVRPSADAGEAAPSAPPPATASVRTPNEPPRSTRSLALLGAVLGVVVVAVGLYAVYRYPGGRVPEPTDPGAPRPAATIPPAALPGLAYLPAETNIVFAVQPGPLLAYAGRTQTDPRRLLPDQLLSLLDRLGLRLDQIDHAAGGLALGGDRPLKGFLVLALRDPPADRSAFLKQLDARQLTTASGQTQYRVDGGAFPLPLLMTNPDPRLYLFGTDEQDLEAAPGRAGRGSDHLPAGLRESIARLSPASFAWAATDTDRWSQNPGVKVLSALAKQPDLPARLAGVWALAVGASLEPEPRLTTAVRADSPNAAEKFQERAVAAAAGKEEVQVGVEGTWVTVDGPPDADAWAGLRAILTNPAGK
jgi:hypothetical protein